VVLVFGDVNSTVATALVAAKLGVKVGHVEAGLRSRDWGMPEEINRVVTDRLSDLLLTPSPDADENLAAEGVPADRIHFVGNIMIDSLVYALSRAEAMDASAQRGLERGNYSVVTLHRPSNVDDPDSLADLMAALAELSHTSPVIFPVHPRTRERLEALGWTASGSADLRLIDPVGYLEMLSLVASAGLVVTDSDGLQEETSYLGVPCITVRPNTERPITCTQGTNQLVDPSGAAILEAAAQAPERRMEGGAKIEKWDGKTAEKIVEVLNSRYGGTAVRR